MALLGDWYGKWMDGMNGLWKGLNGRKSWKLFRFGGGRRGCKNFFMRITSSSSSNIDRRRRQGRKGEGD